MAERDYWSIDYWMSPYWSPTGFGDDPDVPRRWQTIGVNQLSSAGFGTNYPFANRPPTSAQYLLGDLWLSYPDDECGYVLPFKVTRLIGFDGSSGNKDITITDAEGTVVLDTAADAETRSKHIWGGSLITLTWSYGETVLRATMRTIPPPWESAKTWGDDITLDAVLDARTYQRLPRRVRSITVGLTRFTAANLVLASGHNVALSAPATSSADGGRRVSRIAIRARPGDGLGRVSGCNDVIEPEIKRINAVGPTPSGDFLVDASGCYRVQRPVTVSSSSPRTVTATPASLRLFNDCGPCCSCDDFVDTYEGIRRLFYRYQAIGERAEAARDTFQDNVSRWEAQRACREAQPAKLVLQAERYGVLFVGGVHCNLTECCTVPLLLRTTFEYFRDGEPYAIATPSLQCKEAKRAGSDTAYDEVEYQPVMTWPVVDTPFGHADPQAQSRFRARLKFDAGAADSVRVTLSVHSPDIFNASTGDLCPLPTVVPPDEVAAIWAANPPPHATRAILQRVSPVSQTAGCGSCP